MNSLVKIIVAVALFGVLSLTPLASKAQLFVFDSPLLNQKAPEFTLNNLKGEKVNLTQYRNNQPTILFFWATWCPHCREQLKEMTKNKDAILGKGIKVLLVDIGEKAPLVSKHVEKNKIGFDVVLDEDESVGEKYGLVGVPTFIFINPQGVVKGVEHYLPEKYEEYFKNKKK